MKKRILFFLLAISICSFSQTGPGGVGSNDGNSILKFWVDASRSVPGIIPTTNWLDLSGNGITMNIKGNPNLSVGTMNGYDAVKFDGTGDRVVTTLNMNHSVYTNVSIISVYAPRINNSGGVWGEDNGGWDRFLLDSNRASFLQDMVSNGSFSSAINNNIANIFPVGNSVITSVFYKNGVTNGTTVYANENLERSFTSNQVGGSNRFIIGDIGSQFGIYDFDGDISEVIVYNTGINTAQRIIMHNYLSAKYDIALTDNNFYNEDENGNFDHKVAGIGQANDGSDHTDSQGTGIIKINTPNDLQNDEYLFWGENVLDADYDFSIVAPANKRYRINTLWRVSEKGDVGTVNFSLAAADLDFTGITSGTFKLIRSTTSDFSTIVEEYDLTLAGGVYSATVSFDDNDYFTLERIATVDLNLTKTVNKAIPKLGDTIVFTVSVTNNGPQSATGVQVKDILPAGFQYSLAGSIIPVGTMYNATTGVWNLSGITIANGQTVNIQIAAIVQTSGAIITNTSEIISIDQEEIDSVPDNGN